MIDALLVRILIIILSIRYIKILSRFSNNERIKIKPIAIRLGKMILSKLIKVI